MQCQRAASLRLAVKSNNDLEVKFTDTGMGISQEAMRDLWKPLITTKPKGMGLGMAMCKRIVEAHSGTISVASKVGEGTTITVKLPIIPSQEGVKPA